MIAPESLATATMPIRRTATIRVDFRGRITMVNDEAELLLGLSRELLYARLFTEFIDEAERPAISQLVRQRHLQIESSIDIGPVTFRSHSGATSPVRLLISLGYAAGNPANYQIVLLPENLPAARQTSAISLQAEEIAAASSSSHAHPELTEILAQLSSCTLETRGTLIARLALVLSSAPNAALYRWQGGQFFFLGGAVLSEGETSPADEFAFTPLTRLHDTVMHSRESYRPNRQDDVRRAVELTGVSPHECILPLGKTGEFCLRLSDTSESKLTDIDAPEHSIAAALEMFLLGSYVEDEPVNDDKFNVTSSAPAAMIPPFIWYCFDQTGRCDHRSPVADPGVESLAHLCERLGGDEQERLHRAIVQSSREAVRAGKCIPLNGWPVTGTQGYVWPETDDMFGLVIVDLADTELPDWHHQFNRAWQHELTQQLRPLRATAGRLMHQCRGSLDADGAFLLDRLDSQVREIERLHEFSVRFSAQTGESDPCAMLDLKLALAAAVQQIASTSGLSLPGMTCSVIAPLSLPQKKAEQLLAAILRAAYAEQKSLALIRCAELPATDRRNIQITFPDLKTDQRAIRQMLSLHRGFHGVSRTESYAPAHLSFARELIRSSGGELTAEPGPDQELTVTLSLPR